MSAPIGCEKTNVSEPADPVSVSSPDQAKIGLPAAYASTLSDTETLDVVPSALVQLMLMLSRSAPLIPAGVTTNSLLTSFVSTIQLPSACWMAPLTTQPFGRLEMWT